MDSVMQGKREIIERRVKNFLRELNASLLKSPLRFEASYHRTDMRIPLRDTHQLSRTPISEGEVWGRDWESGYFQLDAIVPAKWEGQRLAARLDFGSEALIYDEESVPLYSLTNGSQYNPFYQKELYQLGTYPASARIHLLVEAAANGLFGLTRTDALPSRDNPHRHGRWEARLGKLLLGVWDEEMWRLALDASHLWNLYGALEPQSVRASRCLRALSDAMNAFAQYGARAARDLLMLQLSKPANASSLHTTVVGHAHIDTAWLWPLAETRRKVARTFASQLELISRYPDYIFGASSPQHYQWLKEDHPIVMQKIRQAVADDRWELQGGMWVEPDCNLVSGESLVRQILHGKNWFKREFDRDVTTCWIPDVFGYPASLPQILVKSGLPFFLTQKMSWSKFNPFPHDTFNWRGIDGSSVLTHFPPEQTYNSDGLPGDLIKAERLFHEKDWLDEFMTLLGIGDGGGGPKEEHIEHIMRSKDLEQVPKAAFGKAGAFFKRLSEVKASLESWTGELYLEYHRGTYTTQAWMKRCNRRMEEGIRSLEALLCCLPATEYPRQEMDTLVKTMLMLQFHDILPGSSIHQVYEDATALYELTFEKMRKLTEAVVQKLFSRDEENLVIYNCLVEHGPCIVRLPMAYSERTLLDNWGTQTPTQSIRDFNGEAILVTLVEVPSQGFLTLHQGDACSPPTESTKDFSQKTRASEDLVLENPLVYYKFAPDASIVEAYDKIAGRQIVAIGDKGNLLAIYHDTPHNYEAWDIDFYYPEQLCAYAQQVSFERAGRGPVLEGIRFHLRIGESDLIQDIWLSTDSTSLTFHTRIDWKETRKLLRVDFPVDPLATEANCEIPFGYISRPSIENTGWDFAKFEFCARRYVDVSVAGYGIALINESKYGYSCRNGRLGMSLLRAPLNPDPDADMGIHEFSYRLIPHSGSLIDSNVMHEAALFSHQPQVFPCASLRRTSICRTTNLPLHIVGEGVTVEALKLAEHEDVKIIRLVEALGQRCTIRLQSSAPGISVVETDLVEQVLPGAHPCALPFDITLNPFEIRTFKEYRASH